MLEHVYAVTLDGDRDTQTKVLCVAETEERANELMSAIGEVDRRHVQHTDAARQVWDDWCQNNPAPWSKTDPEYDNYIRERNKAWRVYHGCIDTFDFGDLAEIFDRNFRGGNAYSVDKIKLFR